MKPWAALGRVTGMLVDPRATLDATLEQPRPWTTGVALVLLLVVLGATTLPRQIGLLAAGFASTGDPTIDLHGQMLLAGLRRLVLVDRLFPPAVLAVAAALTALGAEPVLMLPRNRRRALWAIVILGLAPLVVQRIGEAAITWLLPIGPGVPPGAIIELPHRFRTGPALFWADAATRPAWLELLDGSVNAIALWSLALWAVGLRRLDGTPRLATWHVALPVAALAGATIIVWVLAGPILALVLGSP